MKTKDKKSKEKIYECEVKRPFMENGQRIFKWIRREVYLVDKGDPIRCYECKGKVRLHRQIKKNGPKDHVEHRERADSEVCSLGHYYQGNFQRSNDPVE